MDKPDFILEFGNLQNLTGSAFAYWRIKPSIKFSKTTERFIVTNFIISPLLFNNHTIAATFPPVIFNTRDEIIELAKKTNTDVILIEELEMPDEDFNFLSFFKEQLASFNKVVTRYSVLYTDNLSDEKKPAIDAIETNDEIDSLQKIRELTEATRNAYLTSRSRAQARDMALKIRKIGNTLNTPSYKYDVENMLALLGNPDDRVEEITGLYFRKFMAIYMEQYETAEKLKKKINQIVKNMGSPD